MKSKETGILVGLAIFLLVVSSGIGIYFMSNHNTENVNSDNKNISSVTTSSIKYDDLNDDKLVDISDATIIQMYINGKTKLNNTKLKAADVNLDGVVNNNDVVLIQKYVAKLVKKLPVKYGDVNGDGVVNAKDRVYLTRYLANWDGYKKIDSVVADVNLDEKVDKTDLELIKRYITRDISKLPIQYGDIDGDGDININDLTELQRYFSGSKKLTDYQLKTADVNLDGKIDVNDMTAFQKYFVGSIDTLPIFK